MSELLAKLASHAKWPDGVPGGSISSITADDVAAACHGMTRHVYLYALAKFCFDANVIPELRRLNRDAVVYRAKIEKWRVDRDQAQVLADLVLVEAISPRTCKSCRGSTLQHNQKPCPSCQGKGFLGPKGKDCAKEMGISSAAWTQSWQRKFDVVFSDFIAFDDQIGKHLRRKLYCE